MAIYEVRFYLQHKEPLTAAEEAALAEEVGKALQKGLPAVGGRLRDRKVYVRRELETHEERAVIKAHYEADIAGGRDWNDPAHGCGCEVCKEWRRIGVRFTIGRKEEA